MGAEDTRFELVRVLTQHAFQVCPARFVSRSTAFVQQVRTRGVDVGDCCQPVMNETGTETTPA
ncbi:hypothetical protein DLE60_23960 [Micromonospora globispora]|nr:hypothetical protein DLE60_23960 [Micromonospora globispora]